MKNPMLTMCMAGAAMMLAAAGPAAAQAISDPVANPARAEANSARDDARKPQAMLDFLNLQGGETVLDWVAGGGYWSEILAGAVGPQGVVYAQGASEAFPGFNNIRPLPMERGAVIPLDDGSVDLIVLSYVYHHMHFSADDGETTPAATQTQLADFARVLKPGGRVLVVEHLAQEGASRAESNEWHRAPIAAAIQDMAGAGLTLTASAPEIYNNPDDPQTGAWRDMGLSGATTGMALLFSKP